MNIRRDTIQLPQIEHKQEIQIDTECPTREELCKAITQMKNGKAPGVDQITADMLKLDTACSTDILYPLVEKVWREEIFPEEWKEGIIVKLPKKGDPTKCGNWRGISLLSIVNKIFYKVILNRIMKVLDKDIRNEQSGFRAGRSCADNINVLRIIIEQSAEFQSPLYLLFIDYEKAFDSINRECIWVALRNRGLPEKLIRLIKIGYTGYRCRVLHKGILTEPFPTETGVRQGCILSPLLFLIIMDEVMRKTVNGKRRGITWNLTETLEDLEYADDACMISHNFQQLRDKMEALQIESSKMGLKINKQKTKLMRVNVQNKNDLQCEEEVIEQVNSFNYLGAKLTSDGGSLKDVEHRINKARGAFSSMNKIWRAKNIKINTKLKVYNTTVKPVLMYGCESWCVTNEIRRKLQTFVNRCLRYILKIWWPETITNEELKIKTRQQDINIQIKKRKYGWIGHALRKDISEPTRAVLNWNPQGKRRQGRPRKTWRRTVEEETQHTIAELKRIAENREQWKYFVNTLCPLGE